VKLESPLLAPFAKIEWAKTEIDNLNERINAFFEANPYTLGSEVDQNGIEVWRYAPPKIPTAFSVSVGAILHSLRSPLDQMLSAIALQTHASPRGVGFPFGRTEDEFEAALAKQKKLPSDAHAMIRTFRPFKEGGNTILFAIHALNTPDKHHPWLIPINQFTATNLETLIVLEGGDIYSVGPRAGRHFVRDMDNNLSQSDHSKQPWIELSGAHATIGLGLDNRFSSSAKGFVTIFYNQSGKPAPGPVPPSLYDHTEEDDMEILTTPPGTKFKAELHPSFNIAFREIEGLEREPVAAVLHQMRQLVERILPTFEKRFFS
jgi:hypothetical protein